MRAPTKSLPLCTCGNRRFQAVSDSRSRGSKRQFTVACLTCGKQQDVSKTAFALCKYLTTHQPTREFLRLYEVES